MFFMKLNSNAAVSLYFKRLHLCKVALEVASIDPFFFLENNKTRPVCTGNSLFQLVFQVAGISSQTPQPNLPEKTN